MATASKNQVKKSLSPGKKAPAKKTAVKTAAKKTVAKKTAVKTAAKKTVAKKTAVKKAIKKSPVKKTAKKTAKKTVAKKTAKKTVAKKTVKKAIKKSPAKKTAKKTVAKKTAVKKSLSSLKTTSTKTSAQKTTKNVLSQIPVPASLKNQKTKKNNDNKIKDKSVVVTGSVAQSTKSVKKSSSSTTKKAVKRTNIALAVPAKSPDIKKSSEGSVSVREDMKDIDFSRVAHEVPQQVVDPGFLTNDDVFDEADHAQWQQLREQAAIHERAINLNRPESHPDFDGKHCIECDTEIPKARLALHKVRCVDCQSEVEKKGQLLNRYQTGSRDTGFEWD